MFFLFWKVEFRLKFMLFFMGLVLKSLVLRLLSWFCCWFLLCKMCVKFLWMVWLLLMMSIWWFLVFGRGGMRMGWVDN